MKIINAHDMIVGRVATFAAKLLLSGEEVAIVNCKDAIVTGEKVAVAKWYDRKVKQGVPSKGPFYPKRSDMLVKRIIRGMLPYKQARGQDAFKRLRCYVTTPEGLMDKEMIVPEGASYQKLPNKNYKRLYEIVRQKEGAQ
jgi:large subunit ribosomal protein L13